MEKLSVGKIRKLIVGENPKDAFAYEVGKEFSTPQGILKITSIIEDESHFYFFGNIRFLIYVEKPDKNVVVWKYVDRMPVMVECII